MGQLSELLWSDHLFSDLPQCNDLPTFYQAISNEGYRQTEKHRSQISMKETDIGRSSGLEENLTTCLGHFSGK